MPEFPDIPRIEHVEPAAWDVGGWTPARMKQAWEAAEEGSLAEAADLTKLAWQDERIKGGLEKRGQTLLKCDLTFEASGDRRRATGVVRKIEADDDFDTIAPSHVLKGLLKWGWSLGVGLAEIVWRRSPEHGDRDLPCLKLWNPRWLRYDRTRRQWFVQTQDAGEVAIHRDDPKWFLFFPYGEHEFWAQGLWWPLAFWWLWKQFAANDWAAFRKAAGSPIPVGSAPEQSKPETRDQWQQKLQDNLRRGRAVVLPPGYSLAYLLAPADQFKTFDEAIKVANKSIDISILKGNLGTEVGGGSLAAAEVHERGEQGQAEEDGGGLSTQIRPGVLCWWALANFGDRALAPWPYWDTEPPEDLKKKGDGLSALAGGLEKIISVAASVGLEIDPADVQAALANAGFSTKRRPPPSPLPALPPTPTAPSPSGD